ncbi:hypothetical protein TIFTF001_031024 [Ficus carica]|uniref:Uncharacterized protein n=1 Tax=Ficus carica TaxID=3494 RepID=A0AA88DU39_FICCA|nr:hypothetical protein TIFTF001_031024 [Ficus carica]
MDGGRLLPASGGVILSPSPEKVTRTPRLATQAKSGLVDVSRDYRQPSRRSNM